MSHRLRLFSTLFLVYSFLPPSLFPQDEVVAIRGARLVTITDGDIDNGVLVMQGGRITAVGSELSVPAGAEVIDGTGKTVLPGLIDGFTNLGAADYASLGTDDDEAIDPVTPQLRITDGFNPDNRFIPTARSFGVTTVLSTPAEGNLISGQSALIDLAGSRIEDMTVRFPVGVHATLGEAPKLRYGPKSRSPMTRMGAAALLRQTLIDAREYADKIERYEHELAEHNNNSDKKKPTPPKRDLKLEALIPVIRAEIPLIVSADRFDDIHTALRIGDEFGLKIILNHGAEAHRLAPELSSRNIPVIWGPSDASFDELESQRGTPTTPRRLHEAGVPFAFQTGSTSNLAGLLQESRSAVVHGLPRDEALEALTLTAATIFGVSDQLGSLEAGKSANIVVFDGDPLELLSKVEMVFIKGKRFDMVN